MPVQYQPLAVAAGESRQLTQHHQVIVAEPSQSPTRLYLPIRPVQFAPLHIIAASQCSADSFVEILPQGSYTIDLQSQLRLIEGLDFVELMADAANNWRVMRGTNVGLIQIEQAAPTSIPDGLGTWTAMELSEAQGAIEFKDSMGYWLEASGVFLPRGDFSWTYQLTVTCADPGAGKVVEVGLGLLSLPGTNMPIHTLYGGFGTINTTVFGTIRISAANDSSFYTVFCRQNSGGPLDVTISPIKLRRLMG